MLLLEHEAFEVVFVVLRIVWSVHSDFDAACTQQRLLTLAVVLHLGLSQHTVLDIHPGVALVLQLGCARCHANIDYLGLLNYPSLDA